MFKILHINISALRPSYNVELKMAKTKKYTSAELFLEDYINDGYFKILGDHMAKRKGNSNNTFQ